MNLHCELTLGATDKYFIFISDTSICLVSKYVGRLFVASFLSLSLKVVVKTILLCAAAGFQSVQSVQKMAGITLAELLQQLSCYL